MGKKVFALYDPLSKRYYSFTDEEIKQRLGICDLEASMNLMQHAINDVNEALINELWKPKAREQILKFLEDKGEVRTSQIKRAYEITFWDKAWNKALNELVKEGMIETVTYGRGKQRGWRLTT